jgi:hypothetical protein
MRSLTRPEFKFKKLLYKNNTQRFYDLFLIKLSTSSGIVISVSNWELPPTLLSTKHSCLQCM